MPGGVPVATVAINSAKNAGILAAQILGVKFPEVRRCVASYKKELEATVLEKSARLEASQTKEAH
jgi:5-(carboxyamino)imidazole ribonucleotide mutase